jgi:predicted methyltransferase
MPEATQPADVLWLHLFYHDLHTALIQARGATAAHFNRAVYERLKPGGSYVIVDHAAAVGAGTSDAQSLHRIEPASVREEVEAAGFILDAESTMLANKDDPHWIKVFDPSIKGETDRFAYRGHDKIGATAYANLDKKGTLDAKTTLVLCGLAEN